MFSGATKRPIVHFSISWRWAESPGLSQCVGHRVCRTWDAPRSCLASGRRAAGDPGRSCGDGRGCALHGLPTYVVTSTRSKAPRDATGPEQRGARNAVVCSRTGSTCRRSSSRRYRRPLLRPSFYRRSWSATSRHGCSSSRPAPRMRRSGLVSSLGDWMRPSSTMSKSLSAWSLVSSDRTTGGSQRARLRREVP